MEVKVRRDGRGVWYCRPYLGTSPTGRAIRPYASFPSARSEEEAREMAETWASHLTADGRVRSARLSDLLGEYNRMLGRRGASPNTVRTYGLFARRYVGGWMSPRTIASEVTPADMASFEQRLLAPVDEGGAGLSRKSVACVHGYLSAAFSHFAASGICPSNPMDGVRRPTPLAREAAAVDEWDFPALDRAVSEAMFPDGSSRGDMERAACAFAAWLALHTGVRVGEACAIRRRDISTLQKTVHVSGNVVEEPGRAPWRREATKGRRCRNVSITSSELETIRAFEAMQDSGIPNLGPSSPIVTCDGRWMAPGTVSRAFGRLRAKLGLPAGITFHSLRHTHATWCLAAGVDLKTLSERMGHADEATTLRIYAHVLPGRDEAAARAFEEAARAASGTAKTLPTGSGGADGANSGKPPVDGGKTLPGEDARNDKD